MLIRELLIFILALPVFFLTMRYNLHMLQLNGYKNSEHFRWLKKNLKQQWILPVGLTIGILRCFLSFLAMDVIVWIWLAVTFLVYHEYRKQKVKKNLVYTPRVKRMVASDCIFWLLAGGVVFVLTGHIYLPGVWMMAASAQFVMVMFVNIINAPMEKAVNHYYIRDAKKKLKAHPELVIIGVTGSYGKTSVKFYLQTLLQSRYSVLVTPESYNTPMGVVRTIREQLNAAHEIFICEMGARHVGDIKEICDIVHPAHGIITSVGPQHLETFFSMENIKNTKFELADAVSPDGMLFLNGDNEWICEKAAGYPNRIFYCTKEGKEGYCATDIALSRLGTEFTVTAPDGDKERFQLRLVGEHNVINVVGAIAVAHSMGIPLRELKVPVRRISPVAHRMQLIEHGNVTIIDDAYNSNPAGSKAAVETLAMFEGMRILITPGMVELGEQEEEYNYKFGTYAANCCDYVLLVGKQRTEPIRKGVFAQGFEENRCSSFDRLEDALTYAYGISGAGHKYILLENDLPDNY